MLSTREKRATPDRIKGFNTEGRMTMRPQKTKGASSIRKCLAVLDSFTWDNPHRTLTEIAEEINAPLPTASRITAVLCEEGFLDKCEGNLYQLGWKCYRMGAIFKASDPTKNVALPHMRKLRDTFNETVSLYQRKGIWRICCEQISSTYPLKRFANPGDRFPLWAGAAGRCFLAYMALEEVDAVFDAAPEEVRLKRTILIDRATKVKDDGYATSIAEREPGVSSVSCPIFNFTGLPIACLTISGPSIRFTDDVVPRIILALLHESRELSIALGAPEELTVERKPTKFPHLQD